MLRQIQFIFLQKLNNLVKNAEQWQIFARQSNNCCVRKDFCQTQSQNWKIVFCYVAGNESVI